MVWVVKLLLTVLFTLATIYASNLAPTQEEVAKLYVATFNRAPDSAGLSYWVNDSHLSLEGIAQSFFDQSETRALYPSSTTNRNFIKAVYNNLFNRDPDGKGWDYWETQLDNNIFPKNKFIIAVINGAKDSDEGNDKTILDNKLFAGLYFSLYGYNDKNFAKTIMQSVTDSQSSLDLVKDTLFSNYKSDSSVTSCIVDFLYYDGTNSTACYVGVPIDTCKNIQDRDEEASWYGFPVKGECLSIGYFQDQEFLSDSGYTFYFREGLFGDNMQPSGDDSYEPKVITISADNLIAKDGTTSISFSPNDIEQQNTLTIQQKVPKSFSDDEDIGGDYQAKSYDFTLSGKSDFIDLIEITMPYDDSSIKTTGDESGAVMAMYYNPDSKQYEAVDYQVDTAKNQVKILTNHLSEYTIFVLANGERYGAFKVINNNTRKAYITATDAYYRFVDSSTATDIINGAISNNLIETTQAYEAGFNAANEWLGLMAAGNGLASAPFSSAFLKALGNSFNHLGFGASVLQASIDFGKGDNVALFTNLSKNIVYNIVNYAGSSALQLSFIGVFAIDYSLNKFASEALSGLEEKWKKIYDECYDDGVKKTHPQWYAAFHELKEKSTNPNRLSDVMETTVYNNVYSGWKDESQMALCAGAIGMSYNALGSLTNNIKDSISKEKIYELMSSLQEPVFDRLRRETLYKLRRDYKKQLEDIKDTLNQIINVKIQESVNSGSTAKYAGYRFRFAPLNDKANKAEWTGTLNSNGFAKGAWRIIGYMQAGSPNRIELFKPTDNPDTATPVKTVEFKTTPPNLLITFEGESNQEQTYGGNTEGDYHLSGYDSDYNWRYDIAVKQKASWSFNANSNIALKDKSDEQISLWFSTDWTSDTDPDGTFQITLDADISGSVDGEYDDSTCTIGKPYYERIGDYDNTWAMFSGHEPTLDYALDGSTISGNYKFTSGGCGGFFYYALRLPVTCPNGDSFTIRGNSIYIRIED